MYFCHKYYDLHLPESAPVIPFIPPFENCESDAKVKLLESTPEPNVKFPLSGSGVGVS